MEARNQADNLVYQVDKLLQDQGDKVPAEVKSTLESQANALRGVLDTADTAELRRRSQELSQALQQAGGLEALLGVCGDDYQMARNIEQAGYRLELVPLVLEHLLEGAGWHDAVSRQLRWARVVRDERPLGYLGQIVTHGFVPALALGALAAFSFAGPLGWLLPLSWWGAQAAGVWRRRRILALRASDLLLLPVVDVAAFLIWVGGFFGRPRPS